MFLIRLCLLLQPDGSSTYFLEIELLETQCHVMDPTPVANCTVRPKRLTVSQQTMHLFCAEMQGLKILK